MKKNGFDMTKGTPARKGRLFRHWLSALLTLCMLLEPLPLAAMAEGLGDARNGGPGQDLSADPVDIAAREADEEDLYQGYEVGAAPTLQPPAYGVEGNTLYFTLGEDVRQLLLSDVLAQLEELLQMELPFTIEEVLAIAEFGSDDEDTNVLPGEEQTALLSVEQLEGDYRITALREFSEAGLMLYTEFDSYTLKLFQGRTVEPTPEPTIAPDDDIEEESTDTNIETTPETPDATEAEGEPLPSAASQLPPSPEGEGSGEQTGEPTEQPTGEQTEQTGEPTGESTGEPAEGQTGDVTQKPSPLGKVDQPKAETDEVPVAAQSADDTTGDIIPGTEDDEGPHPTEPHIGEGIGAAQSADDTTGDIIPGTEDDEGPHPTEPPIGEGTGAAQSADDTTGDIIPGTEDDEGPHPTEPPIGEGTGAAQSADDTTGDIIPGTEDDEGPHPTEPHIGEGTGAAQSADDTKEEETPDTTTKTPETTPDTPETTPDTLDTTTETTDTPESPITYPAQSFTARTSRVRVSVEAGEGAFPEGTRMKVVPVWARDTLNGIRESVSGDDDAVNVMSVAAVDITFYDKDGNEIEPLIPISVVMSVDEIDETQQALVVHVDDAGNAAVVADAEASGDGEKLSLNVEMAGTETADAISGTEADEGPHSTSQSPDTLPTGEGTEASGITGSAEAVSPESTTVTFAAEAFSVYAVVIIETRYIAANGETYEIKVSYDARAGIPAGAALEVSEITGAEGEAYAAAAAAALDGAGIAYAKALDIKIVKDGEELQPQAPVNVSIRLLDAPGDASDENLNVLHFGNEVEPVDCALNAGAVEFRAEGFSVYVIVQTIKEQILEASDGNNYKITVEYDNTSGIPMDAELEVSELNENDPYFTEYVEKTAEVLGKEARHFEFAHAFDIKLVDPESGEKYQPTKDVKVSIELLTEDIEAGDNVSVVHFRGDVNRETGEGTENDESYTENLSAQIGDAEVLDASVNKEGIVEFESGSFSVYVVTQDAKLRKFVFWDYEIQNGTAIPYKYHEQVLMDGEHLVRPTDPTQAGAVFDKWQYIEAWNADKSAPETLSDFSFSTYQPVHFTDGFPGYLQDELDDHAVEFFAVYKDQKTVVTFYNQSGLVVEKIEKLKPAEGAAAVTVDTTQTKYNPIQDKEGTVLSFNYWTTDAHGKGSQAGTNGVIEITASSPNEIALYPNLSEGHYIYFDGNKEFYGISSVPYTGPAFVPSLNNASQSAEKALENLNDRDNNGIPIIPGYTFKGWYAEVSDADDGEGHSKAIFYPEGGEMKVNQTQFNNLLSPSKNLPNNPTLYAHWTKNTTATYTIIVWTQNVEDNKNTAVGNRKYDFEGSYLVTATIGATPNTTYQNNDLAITKKPEGFQNARVTGLDQKVKEDNSTIVNIYFDRNLVTFNYYTCQYTQYNSGSIGYVDGKYVRLSSNTFRQNWNYYYAYWSYEGVPYVGKYYIAQNGQPVLVTGDLSASTTYYGVIDGYYRQLTRNAYSGNKYTTSWTSYDTFTGLYGQTLKGNGYTWPSEYDWYTTGDNYGGTSGTRTTFLDAFLPTDTSATTLAFYGGTPTGGKTIYFYKQNINTDGTVANTYTKANEVSTSGGSFYLSDKYNGFKAYQYSADGGIWTDVGVKNGEYYNNGDPVSYDNTLEIRFNRTTADLIFNPNYKDEHGNAVAPDVRQDIPYEAPLSNYTMPVPARSGYRFTGWYYDQTATGQPVSLEEFNARTMPIDNLSFYAGWEMVKYNVNLIPNGGEMDGQGVSFNLHPSEQDNKISLDANPTRDYVKASSGTFEYDSVKGHYQEAGETEDGEYIQKSGAYIFLGWYKAVLNMNGESEQIVEYKPGKYTKAIGHYEAVEAGKGRYVESGNVYSLSVDAQDKPTGNFNFVNAKPQMSGSEPVTEDTTFNMNTVITEPVTLVAKWQRAGGFYVRYNTVDETLHNDPVTAPVDENEYIEGAHAEVLAPITAPQGYTLDYWKGPVDEKHRQGKYYPNDKLLAVTDGNAVTETNGDSVVWLTAVYRPFEPSERTMADYDFMINVKEDRTGFNTQYRLYQRQRIAVNEELRAPITPSAPTVSGHNYAFKGWYFDPQGKRPFDGFGVVTNPVYTTIYAVFEEVYTVNYYMTSVAADGTTSPSQTILATQTYPVSPAEDLDTRRVTHLVDLDHYVLYWVSDWDHKDDASYQYDYKTLTAKKVNASAVGMNTTTNTLNLYAVLKARQYVYFNTQCDAYVPYQEVAEGGWPVKPDDPVRPGYVFGGWYTQQLCEDQYKYDFHSSLGDVTTLFAKWTPLGTSEGTLTVVWWAQTADRPEDTDAGYTDDPNYDVKTDTSYYQLMATQTLEVPYGTYGKSVYDTAQSSKGLGLTGWNNLSTVLTNHRNDTVTAAFIRSTLGLDDNTTITNDHISNMTRYYEYINNNDYMASVDATVTVDDTGNSLLNIRFMLKQYTFKYNAASANCTVKIYAGGNEYTGENYSYKVWLGKDISKQWPIKNTERENAHVNATGTTPASDPKGAWVKQINGSYNFSGWTDGTTPMGTLQPTADKSKIDKAAANNDKTYKLTVNSNTNATSATLHYMEWNGEQYVEMQELGEVKNINVIESGNNKNIGQADGCNMPYFSGLGAKPITNYNNVTDQNGEPNPARNHNHYVSDSNPNNAHYVKRTQTTYVDHYENVYKNSFNTDFTGVKFYSTVTVSYPIWDVLRLYPRYIFSNPVTRIEYHKDTDLENKVATDNTSLDGYSRTENNLSVYAGNTDVTGKTMYYQDQSGTWYQMNWATYVSTVYPSEQKTYKYQEEVQGDNSYDLYFYYEPQTFTLTLIDRNHTVATESVKYKAQLTGKNGTLGSYLPPSYTPADASHPAPAGKVFKGWGIVDRLSDANDAYSTSDGKMPAHNVTLYAIWAPITYGVETVGLDQDGKYITDPDNVDNAIYPARYDQALKETDVPTNLTRAGYIFAGWKLVDTAEKEGAAISGNYKIKGNIQIEPIWTALTTKQIEYNANGGAGTVPTDSNLYLVGAKVSIKDGKDLMFERTDVDGNTYNATFASWNTKADGTGVSYYPNTILTFHDTDPETLTLYAIYSQYRETVLLYDKNATAAEFKMASDGTTDYDGQLTPEKRVRVLYRDSLSVEYEDGNKFPNQVFPVAQDERGVNFIVVRKETLGEGMTNNYIFGGWTDVKDGSLAIAQNGDRAYVNTIDQDQYYDEDGKRVYPKNDGSGYKYANGDDVTKSVYSICNPLFALWGICKIQTVEYDRWNVRHEYERLFPTIQAAVDFVHKENNKDAKGNDIIPIVNGKKTATIEMLIDYYKPNSDAVTIYDDCDITLTTAELEPTNPVQGKHYFYDSQGKVTADQGKSVITRAENGGSMFDNQGSLTITNLIIDGGSKAGLAATQFGGIVRVTDASAQLTLSTDAVLRNSSVGDKDGGAVRLISGSRFTMEENATITGCSAGKGGAVYAKDGDESTVIQISGTSQLSKNSATATTGGAIATSGKATVTVTDSVSFSENTAATGGGAIDMSGDAVEKSLTITGATFSNNETTGNAAIGGAVRTSAKSTVSLTNCTFKENKAIGNGGAIAVQSSSENPSSLTIDGGTYTKNTSGGDGGAARIGTGGTMTVKGNVTIGGSDANANTAANGGALAAAGTINLQGCAISYNTASANGGAVYLESGAVLNMGTGNSITNNTAVKGGGVYSAGTVNLSGTAAITGNKTSTATVQNGGGVYMDGSSEIHVQDSVKISGNTTSAGTTKSNLRLANGTSCLVVDGDLTAGADIGISNNANPAAEPMVQIGIQKDDVTSLNNVKVIPEGAITSDIENLYAITYGIKKVVWNFDPICKLTDKDDNLLYKNNDFYEPAVYLTLRTALTDARQTLKNYDRTPATDMSSTNPRQIKMLKDYTILSDDNVTLNDSDDNILLTTAETQADHDSETAKYPGTEISVKATMEANGDNFCFVPVSGFASRVTGTNADSNETAILARGWDGGATEANALFYLNDASAKLSIQNITFDGKSKVGTETALTQKTGRAIYVKTGALSINDGSTFRNSSTPGCGGAIYTKTDIHMDDNTGDILFDQCVTTVSGGYGGAIYYEQNFYMDRNKGSITFSNCTGGSGGTDGDGGAISTWTRTGTAVFSAKNNEGSILFDSCVADGVSSQGGAIFMWRGDGSSITMTNKADSDGTIRFVNCRADGTNDTDSGGAISVWSDSSHPASTRITLTGTAAHPISFENCYAGAAANSLTSNGGAILNKSGSQVTLDYVSFDRCKANNGGALYTDGPVTLNHSTLEDCKATNGSGGALYTNGPVTLNHSTFEDCKATNGSGGAVYTSSTGDLTISNTTFGALNSGVEDSTLAQRKLLAAASIDTTKACTATSQGGAVYTKSKGTIHITNTKFYGSTAGNNGGAIHHEEKDAANKKLVLEQDVFINCDTSTSFGSAICENTGSVRSSKKTTIKECVFNDCDSKIWAPVIIRSEEVQIDDSAFARCTSTKYGNSNGNGGAICLLNLDTASFSGDTFKSCSTEGAGGALHLNEKATTGLTIEGCTFEDCKASVNGGAVYANAFATELNNVTVNGHTEDGLSSTTANAVMGSAIYATGNLTVKQTGTGTCEIKNCSASGDNGGAVNLYGAKSVSFGGDVVVEGNTNTTKDTEHEHNMVLEQNNNTTIKTTDVGLGENAHIGVYVTGDDSTNPYKGHGTIGLPFGTWAKNQNLNRFTNDRNEELFGVDYLDAGKDTADALVYWGRFICKITDTNGGKNEHAFPTLNKAVAYARTNGNGSAMSAANPVKIEMLVDYVVPAADKVTLDQPDDNIIITTAATSGGVYNFKRTFTVAQGRTPYVPEVQNTQGEVTTPESGDRGDVAILQRGWNMPSYYGERPLFNVNNASASLTTRKLTFDGKSMADGDTGLTQKTGRAVCVKAGSLSIEDGTTVRNFRFGGTKYPGGGAVQMEGSALTIRNSVFENCGFEDTFGANNDPVFGSGGAVYSKAVTNVIENSVFTGNKGHYGGAICVDGEETKDNDGKTTYVGQLTVTGGSMTGNAAGYGGGAISAKVETVTITGVYFENNTAESSGTGGSGGAVAITSSKATLEDNTFIGNHANTRYGGAVSVGGSSSILTVESGTFTGNTAKLYGGAICADGECILKGGAFTGNSAEERGGAVYANVSRLTMTGGTMTGNTAPYGGAVYIYGKDASLTMTGGTISGNSATNGGAVYVDVNAIMTLKNGETTPATHAQITGNTATTAGAGVYLVQGAKLNLSGSPDFGGSGMADSGELFFLESKTVAGKTLYRRGYKGDNGSVYPDSYNGEDLYYLLEDGGIYRVDSAGNYLDSHTETVEGATVTVGNPVPDGIPIGNFVTLSGYGDKQNGGKSYPTTNQVRQDIYIAGYLGTTDYVPATSLCVGEMPNTINNDVGERDGSIWVWAETPSSDNENNHYQQLKQFAVFAAGLTEAQRSSTARVFRNAADDESTQNGTDSYLTGSLEGDLTVPNGAAYAGYIYWSGVSGSRRVLLRKVNGSYAPVKDRSFTVYKGTSTNAYVVKNKANNTPETLESLNSLDSGVIWTGNLPYGWYILEESGAEPKYFFLVVTANGTYETIDDAGNNQPDGYSDRGTAEAQAKKVNDANK